MIEVRCGGGIQRGRAVERWSCKSLIKQLNKEVLTTKAMIGFSYSVQRAAYDARLSGTSKYRRYIV
jgi:ribosomal protein S26